MKKGLFLSLLVAILFSFTANANVYIKYVNLDDKSYTFDVVIDGKKQKVTFGENRTTSVKIDGNESQCTIETPCGKVTLTNKSTIVIENGCINFN